jgi:BirA family transcriptional regulator, biotin operon repressor / biotin---[acetyl-CoA-carboxylase] ligase
MARSLNIDSLLPLLRTLADGGWHSGEALAREAGITRAGLSKRLQKLMQWGLEIETQPGRGCRLLHPLELLDADLVRGALPPGLRARIAIRVLAGTDSTNTQLMAANGAGDPQALLAEHQSAGRGRHGRSWHSPFGTNLYLSLAWTFPQWPAELTALPLATGVATAAALDELRLESLRLKWPNDLWCGDAKLGGILIEQRGESGGACRVVIGLGLNVAMRSATTAHIGAPWTTLAEQLGKAPSRNALAGRILAQWVAMLERFAREGFAPFEPGFRALDLLRNRAVQLALPDGELGGIARGVDETGALLVDTGDTRRRILSGDVSLRVTPQ